MFKCFNKNCIRRHEIYNFNDKNLLITIQMYVV